MPITHQPGSGGRKAPACRSAFAALALLLAPTAQPAAQPAPVSPPAGIRTECNSAGLAFSQVGATRLQAYQDGHGNAVELWCVRSVFGSNFDLRVVRGGQSKTVAGCYFSQAENKGPLLHLAPNGAYAQVEWLNESLRARGTSYRFQYDFAADQVTVTASAACRPPATVTLPPQPDFRQLERLLPPDTDCPPGS